MNHSSYTLPNADYIEELYLQYLQNPETLDEKWKLFFAGFELGLGKPQVAAPSKTEGTFSQLATRRGDGVGDLVHSYRELGHWIASIDPLGDPRPSSPLLKLENFGFTENDFSRVVGPGGFLGATDGTLGDLVAKLRKTYCGNIGIEYLDIPDKRRRDWLQDRMEPGLNQPQLSKEQKLWVLEGLFKAEEFETFLHTKYVGQKRFSLQGSESLIPLLEMVLEEGASLGMEQAVFGMAHRGRLNVLAHTLEKPYEYIFGEFEGVFSKEELQGDGDVKYHKGFSADRKTRWSGKTIHCSLIPNPSHLELVNPVVEGIVYAKQQHFKDEDRTRFIPILIHGDAAFCGQGIVTETINLCQLKGFDTGGTVHIIVNNQLGFTANAVETRASIYPTNLAKMIHVPVIHVNGDDAEAVVLAAKLAMEYRQAFKSDVILDLWCYRKYGHNETDDPTFTQPVMYQKISKQIPVAEKYAMQLQESGVATAEEIEGLKAKVKQELESSFDKSKTENPREKLFTFGGLWEGLGRAGDVWSVPTDISSEVIRFIVEKSLDYPEGFEVHKKLKKILALRSEMVQGKKNFDWATSELLAFGSLLLEGYSVRLVGQDSERGTFSHRHLVLNDEKNGQKFLSLSHLEEGQGKIEVHNTMLSELAVVGFEYGYSSANPRTLVLWEAQFGDFVNGAQPIIDQFVSSCETKWQRMNGLVMLLPHGYEGQGPEHSSGRLERFLQLCGEFNMQVCYPSTPSQYFHLLRRQMLRKFRKPMILMMPKSLLRDDRSSSEIGEFSNPHFREIIPDARKAEGVKTVVLCTGKVYFALSAKREELKDDSVALIRVEQLYPFPEGEIKNELLKYKKVQRIIWAQEEPKNMGAYSFVFPRILPYVPSQCAFEYCGRKESASPATGLYKWHQQEELEFLNQVFKK